MDGRGVSYKMCCVGFVQVERVVLGWLRVFCFWSVCDVSSSGSAVCMVCMSFDWGFGFGFGSVAVFDV